MPFKIKRHTNESADLVFAGRKKEVLDRRVHTRGIVSKIGVVCVQI